MRQLRRELVVALTVAVAAAGCGSAKTHTVTRNVAVPRAAKNAIGPPAERVLFGHIASLTRSGAGYRLRFDPAWFLSGATANTAAAEDGAVEPGEPVPNDNYVLEEGHRLLTFLVAGDAGVTVLTRHGDPARSGATRITVPQLARIVRGTSRLPLFEPLDTGVWIRVDVDIVRAIDQQYRP